MYKKAVTILSIVSIFFVLTTINISASSNMKSETVLSQNELEYLLHTGGFTAHDLDILPTDTLKKIVKLNGKKLGDHEETVSASIQPSTGDFVAHSISDDDLWLHGIAVGFTPNNRPNTKGILLFGQFEWLNSPQWELTDVFSIGYPVSSEIYLPMDQYGDVDQHGSRYCKKPDNYAPDNWVCIENDQVENGDWDPGVGVAARYDLDMHPSNYLHKGSIEQYAYVDDDESGTINIKFEYGHRIVSGSPSISIFPAGLSITPSLYTDIKDYGIEFSY